MLKYLCFASVCWAAFFLLMTDVSGETRPNVLVIYTDDQGFGDVGHLNAESRIPTPHLDRLAAEGVSFTDAHCSDTVCTPSRYGLLTGRYSWRTELKRGVFGAERACLISDDCVTLASFLKEHGYHTAMVGKWHLGMDFPGEPGKRDWSQPVRDMPLDKGFDYFWGIPASMNYGILAWFEGRYAAVPPTLYTAKKPNSIAISDYRIRPPYDESPEATRKRLGTRGFEVAPDFEDAACLTKFTEKTIEYLRGRTEPFRKGQPFFLYLAYTSPHKPVIPLKKYRGLSKAGAYGDFVIETDDHIGEIMKCLDEQGLADHTLVIFTSDNGPENTWKERLKRYGHDSSGVYREGKRSIYEGGHRVPMIVRWPAGIEKPGRTCDATVCQTDVLATLADMLKSRLPDHAGEDSQSFLPLLKNVRGASPRVPVIHHAANGRFAVRDGQWKLVMPHRKDKTELYDLSRDPAETNDVAAEHPQVVERLTEAITSVILNGRSTPGAAQPNDTDWWEDLTWITPEAYRQAATSEAAR